jgi:hypothetical protein
MTPYDQRQSRCSFRWISVAESTVRWFVMREKHCWMATDSADPAKRTGCILHLGRREIYNKIELTRGTHRVMWQLNRQLPTIVAWDALRGDYVVI